MDPTSESKQWVACFGTMTDGFKFVGVFETPQDAIEWCEDNIHADDWTVFNILTDEQFQKENA